MTMVGSVDGTTLPPQGRHPSKQGGLKSYNGVFLPGFVEQKVEGEPVGIMIVDHIVGNVELGKMNVLVRFLSRRARLFPLHHV